MFNKKKCDSCKEKVHSKYSYCPWCGNQLNKKKGKKVSEEDYGMIGADDEIVQDFTQIKLPPVMDGLVNNLMKQFEKEFNNFEGAEGIPHGFKIKISTGNPNFHQINNTANKDKNFSHSTNITKEEMERRANLKKVNAKSAIRRLPEGVVYEIDAPGVKTKNDITITKLEQSIEIKAYSKDKCYVKSIPMKVEITGVSVKNNKVYLKIKG